MNLKKRITALLCAFAIAVMPLFAFAEEEQASLSMTRSI